jgi:beta-glucanase (GH16 family)
MISEDQKNFFPDKNPNTWKLIWHDEFDAETLDLDIWNFNIGSKNNGWGNKELQYYTDQKSNIYLENSCLIIQALAEDFEGFKYTSGRIHTYGKFNFKYGYIEMKAKLPYGQGMWPAFWMLGADYKEAGWPNCGEIDIMEYVGKDPRTTYGALHGYNFKDFVVKHEEEEEFYKDFHVYGLRWKENEIRWYYDGKEFGKAKKRDENWCFNKEFYFLLNLAVGGKWPGSPNDQTIFPQKYVIDYIRVYDKA